MSELHDIVIVGGGCVGLATAMALAEAGRSVLVIEAEDRLAAHQSGHNSGVIHAGLYYQPGSLKSRLCGKGREALYRFCADHGIRHERCGKLVVAVDENEAARLVELQRRGERNGLPGIEHLDPDRMKEREPHVQGVAGLYIPQTGIVDFADVCRAYGTVIAEQGGEVRLNMRFRSARQDGTRLVIETDHETLRGKLLINCAGLQSDRVAMACGYRPSVRIIPFRGGYDELVDEARHLVRHLIYPVPDPRYPFLGVHFTRMVDGAIEVGPTALLTLSRHGYRPGAFSLRDTLAMLGYRGFWRFSMRHWKAGLAERRRIRRPDLQLAALRKLVPELKAGDLRPGRSGVRAMAVDPQGRMVDDFRIARDNSIIHVLNAPSPAATASIAIGRYVAGLADRSA